ncbi:MAG: hypothetical protein ACOYM3_33435, partial [Terrimicrobiaceae bacterium]
MSSVQAIAPPSSSLSAGQIPPLVEEACAGYDWDGKRVLVIVPDATRTAPVGPVFRALHSAVAGPCRAFDVMVALGTHPPMSGVAICERLEITVAEKASTFSGVNLFNHEWDNPEALACLGSIPAKEIEDLLYTHAQVAEVEVVGL